MTRIYSTRTDAHQRTRDRSDGHTRWPTWRDRIAELRADARAIGEPPLRWGVLFIAALAVVVWAGIIMWSA